MICFAWVILKYILKTEEILQFSDKKFSNVNDERKRRCGSMLVFILQTLHFPF